VRAVPRAWPRVARAVIEIEELRGGMVLLAMARPPVNALDHELVLAVDGAVRAACSGGARGIVLSGQGRCFSAGIDTKALPTYGPQERRAAVRAINEMVRTLCAVPVPLVAAINGHALGGGLIVALACDMRLVARGEHRLALNEGAAGVPFPAGPLRLVMAELDPSVARNLCLTSRTFGPEEAVRMRVADTLAEPAELIERSLEQARSLAQLPAYAAVKAQLRAPLIADLDAVLAAGEDPLFAGPSLGLA
jgi:enoyl-CoA hydratase